MATNYSNTQKIKMPFKNAKYYVGTNKNSIDVYSHSVLIKFI